MAKCKSIRVNGVNFRVYKLRHLINDDNREPNKPRYTRIALQWNWHYADCMTVQPVPKTRNKARITNGGHRYHALLIKYPDLVYEDGPDKGKDVEVLCAVLKPEHDACDAFIDSNFNTKAPTVNERFKRRLDAGKKPEMNICNSLNDKNVFMVFTASVGRPQTATTCCASQWLKLYHAAGGKVKFNQLVNLMADIWWRPDHETIENAALSSNFVGGLAHYVKRSKYTISQIRAKLDNCDLSSADLCRKAEVKYFTPVGYSRVRGIFFQFTDMIGGVNLKKYATHKQMKQAA